MAPGQRDPKRDRGEHLATWIFKCLTDFGSRNHKDHNPSKPQVPMVGLRSLSLSWARVRPAHFVEFLQNAPASEETRLSDVGGGALQAMVPLEGLLGRRGKYEGCTANTLTRCLRGARVIIICKKFAGNVNSSIPGVLKAQFAKQDSDDWSISSYYPVSSISPRFWSFFSSLHVLFVGPCTGIVPRFAPRPVLWLLTSNVQVIHILVSGETSPISTNPKFPQCGLQMSRNPSPRWHCQNFVTPAITLD